MSHDFDAQKAETIAAITDIAEKNDLPDMADLDFFFLPVGEDAHWPALADALTKQGYICEFIEDEEDEPPYLVATIEDQPVTATAIWISEEVATRTALEHGFKPDGWGFSAD